MAAATQGGGAGAILPANADGSSGNLATFPQFAVGKGPMAPYYALGTCKDDGSQVVRIYNQATGALLEAEHVVRDIDAKDDHNPVAVVWYPSGHLLCAAAGHNADTVLNVSIRDPDGTWTDSTVNFASNLTYPNLFIDNDGKVWLFIRVGNLNWSYRTKATVGAAWSAATQYLNDAEQIYSYQRYIPETHSFYGWIITSSESANYGTLKPWNMDAATGVFTEAAGTLALPFDQSDVTTLAAPAVGFRYSSFEMSADGRAILVTTTEDAAVNNVDLAVWTITGAMPAARLSIGNYAQNATFVDQAARIAYGTNNNAPGAMFAREPHTGLRLYVGRSITIANQVSGSGNCNRWAIEQWNCPSGDGVTWTSTELVSQPRRGSSVGPVVCRPMSAEGANARTPVCVSRMDSFTEYDTYTDARTEFIAPWRGRAAATWETEAQAYFDRLASGASDLFKHQVNAAIRGLNDEGLTSLIGFMFLAPTETREQRETSLFGGYTATAFDASNVATTAAFTARTFANGNGTFYYKTGVIPGAGNSLMTQNGHMLFVGSCEDVQGGSAGNQQIFVSPRSSADTFQTRSASLSTDSTTVGARGTGRGCYGLRRSLSASYHKYNGSGAASTNPARTSAALDGTQLMWLTINNGSDGVSSAAAIPDRDQAYMIGGNALAAPTDNVKIDTILDGVTSRMVLETS